MDKSTLSAGPQRPRGRSPEATSASIKTSVHQDFPYEEHRPPAMAQRAETRRVPRKLVLCFDGTGNKFHGDEMDSNILKIFRMLDRTADDQYHYYQPGIGTYVVSTSLTHTGVMARMKSWYIKAKDSAIGSSFDQHVVGGYRFLMRFYSPGDEIYFFGFSRGAYVARFLAEMLDYVGLLSHGNEEMVVFAWKAFSRWQARRSDDSEEGQAKKKEMYQFMRGFRETFSRPVKRLRFLGLFDTVNSVPRFETAWMQRSKFPYTARSSAKVIRHAVSIDERRAKFRQDLIYQGVGKKKKGTREKLNERYRHRLSKSKPTGESSSKPSGGAEGVSWMQTDGNAPPRGRHDTLAPSDAEQLYRPRSRSRSKFTQSDRHDAASVRDGASVATSEVSELHDTDDSDDEGQDVDEVWFAGGHGDVGGGWEILADGKSASHIPLAYMVREAQKAGLRFDSDRLVELGCAAKTEEETIQLLGADPSSGGVPDIRIDATGSTPGSPNPEGNPDTEETDWAKTNWDSNEGEKPKGEFHSMIEKAHVALIHDSLEFKSGLGFGQVTSWNLMEYMPFRRMDLQQDGSWKPIRWPLPMGETRDIPNTARVHGSVIRRLKNDPDYRPGNLIIGGGGRGVRKAGPEHGIGEWECVAEPGHLLGEIFVKKADPAPEDKQ